MESRVFSCLLGGWCAEIKSMGAISQESEIEIILLDTFLRNQELHCPMTVDSLAYKYYQFVMDSKEETREEIKETSEEKDKESELIDLSHGAVLHSIPLMLFCNASMPLGNTDGETESNTDGETVREAREEERETNDNAMMDNAVMEMVWFELDARILATSEIRGKTNGEMTTNEIANEIDASMLTQTITTLYCIALQDLLRNVEPEKIMLHLHRICVEYMLESFDETLVQWYQSAIEYESVDEIMYHLHNQEQQEEQQEDQEKRNALIFHLLLFFVRYANEFDFTTALNAIMASFSSFHSPYPFPFYLSLVKMVGNLFGASLYVNIPEELARQAFEHARVQYAIEMFQLL